MNNVKVTYKLSNEGQKNVAIKGLKATSKQEIFVPLKKEFKNVINIDYDGNTSATLQSYEAISSGFSGSLYASIAKEYILYNDILSEEDVLKELQQMSNALEIVTSKAQELEEALLKENEIVNNKRKEEIKNKEIENKQEEEIRRARKENENIWINENGSSYLKKALELGHNCKRLIFKEIVNKHFNEFDIDFTKSIDYEQISTPSEKAVEKVFDLINIDTGYEFLNLTKDDIKIVWLMSCIIPYGEDECDYDDYEPREAIVISKFNYELVLTNY